MYTRCPNCKVEIYFEPPVNIEGLPRDYKHRIKCPNCGVTVGVKIMEANIPKQEDSTMSFDTNAQNDIAFDIDRKNLKEKAKDIISGNMIWKILFALIVKYMISAVVSSALSPFATIFLVPLKPGLDLYMLNVVRNRKDDMDLLFNTIKDFVQIFLCNVITGLQIVLGSLLIVPGIIWALKYSQINYVLADNPGISWIEARNRSKELMKGNEKDLFVFYLSFIGWILLVVFTFGVAIIYVSPYYKTSRTIFYEMLLSNNLLKKIDEINIEKESDEDVVKTID